MKTLKPMFSYFGSKNQLSKLYPKPARGRVFEAFAGSAQYAHRHHRSDIVLVERDPVVAELWRWLIHDATPERVLSLPDPQPGDDLREMDLCPGERHLMGFWLMKAAPRPKVQVTERGWYMRYRNHPHCKVWNRHVRERVASQLPAIRHWTVLNCSYDEVPNEKATWFVDPPYISRGAPYVYGSSGIDYPALGRWCRGRWGRTIVCEANGARWLPFRRLAACRSQVRSNSQYDEVVWVGRRAAPVPLPKLVV